MKIFKSLILCFSLALSSKFFIKCTPFIGVIVASKVEAQNYSIQGNTSDNSWSLFETNSPSNLYGNRREPIWMNTSWYYRFRVRKIFLDTINTKNYVMSNVKMIWVDSSSAEIKISPLSALRVPYSQVTDTPTIPAQYNPSSGSGVVISGSYPNHMFSLSSSVQNDIDSRALKITTITINGLSNDLSSSGVNYNLTTGNISEGSNLYFTTVRARTSISSGLGIGYDNSTGVITNTSPDQVVSISSPNENIIVTGSYPSFTVQSTRTFTTQTRSLNSSFTISATRDYDVCYSVYTQASSALIGTNTADVFLEYSSDNSSWTTIGQAGVQVSGVVSTSGNTIPVCGVIPAGYWVRIRTSASGTNSGSAVFTYKFGSEVQH